MKKFIIIVIGLFLSFQMLQANQIEKTVVLNAGYNAVQFDANVTLEELKNKIGAENLLNIQGAGQGSTYKKEYDDNGLSFLNSFTQTEAGKAFWFKVAEDITFTYMADKQVNDKDIALGEGWSFVGAMLPLTLEEIKEQLGEDNLLVIQGAGQGSTYKKEYVDNGTSFLNSFTAFEVGKGYWVKVASPATLSFIFNLDKIAKDNAGNSAEVTRTIGGEVYTVRVYSDSVPTTEISQGTIAVYGNVNGEMVTVSINDSYPTDARFQVKVFDANGNWVTQSNIVDYNASAIEFATLTISNIHLTLIKKTRQTISYYPKDDGDYQKGERSFYTRDDRNGIVYDLTAKLQWQDNKVVKTNLLFGYDEIKDYCTCLCLGGYHDWRLPTIKELKNIIDYGHTLSLIHI